jgi:hypothetical protein
MQWKCSESDLDGWMEIEKVILEVGGLTGRFCGDGDDRVGVWVV